MKKWIIITCAVMFCLDVLTETVTNNLDVQGGFVYNHGIVAPGDIGMTFTNAGIRDITVSVGQLSGVNPEDGSIITNDANLLSIKAHSLNAASNIVAGGVFVGDGSGLTNLNAGSVSGMISASCMPTSGIWDASGVRITDANLEGTVIADTLSVVDDLTVQGVVSGNGSGLTNVTVNAGDPDGSFQFNNSGDLSGHDRCFVHPDTQRLTYRCTHRNIFRVYEGDTVSDTNLNCSLRSENGAFVLRFRNNGEDKIVLSSDGSMTLGGETRSAWPDYSILTYIPPQGDLAMGVFTNGVH